MSEQQSGVEGVSQETLDTISDRVLDEERDQLNYRQPQGIRPVIKQIIEEEVTEANLPDEMKE